MALPPSIASFVALAGLVTVVKSSWELTRMVRKKHDERETYITAEQLSSRLRRAYREDRITKEQYDRWYKKLYIAVADEDCQSQ